MEEVEMKIRYLYDEKGNKIKALISFKQLDRIMKRIQYLEKVVFGNDKTYKTKFTFEEKE